MNEVNTPEWDKLVSLGCAKIRSYAGGIYVGISELHIWAAYNMDGQVVVIPFPPDTLQDVAKYSKDVCNWRC